MSEMNEKDLEQVVGGAAGGEFDSLEWYSRNCLNCAKKKDCSSRTKDSAMRRAGEEAKAGREWNCDMRA